MCATVLNLWPILARSTDSVLKMSDFVFNILVPVALVIMVLGAIFGKKD